MSCYFWKFCILLPFYCIPFTLLSPPSDLQSNPSSPIFLLLIPLYCAMYSLSNTLNDTILFLLLYNAQLAYQCVLRMYRETRTHGKHIWTTCKFDTDWSESDPGTWSCDAVLLTTVPPLFTLSLNSLDHFPSAAPKRAVLFGTKSSLTSWELWEYTWSAFFGLLVVSCLGWVWNRISAL